MIDLKGKVLVVVDMEFGYRRSMTEPQIQAVISLIRAAIEAEALIVFLEYLDRGTLKRLLHCVRRYDSYVQQRKFTFEGSSEVLDVCKRNECDTAGFVVCGVDTHCCVAGTAEQLALKLPGSTVEVAKEGCGDRWGNRWDEFPTAPNIKLVSMDC